MTKSRRWTYVALLAAVVGVALLTYGVIAIAESYNLRQVHLVTGNSKQVTCSGYAGGMSCHDLGSRITKDAHRTHKSPMFLAFYDKPGSDPAAGAYDGCGRCHQVSDIIEGSGAKIRKQVDVSGDDDYDPKVVCADCHGTGTKTSTHLAEGVVDADGNILQPYGCLQSDCHLEAHAGIGTMGPVAAHTNVTWISHPYSTARAYCTKCHGGLALFRVEEDNPLP